MFCGRSTAAVSARRRRHSAASSISDSPYDRIICLSLVALMMPAPDQDDVALRNGAISNHGFLQSDDSGRGPTSPLGYISVTMPLQNC
jgi:hypothetical protein